MGTVLRFPRPWERWLSRLLERLRYGRESVRPRTRSPTRVRVQREMRAGAR